jgi:hypothetical protein
MMVFERFSSMPIKLKGGPITFEEFEAIVNEGRN